jgi:hypothetical protein
LSSTGVAAVVGVVRVVVSHSLSSVVVWRELRDDERDRVVGVVVGVVVCQKQKSFLVIYFSTNTWIKGFTKTKLEFRGEDDDSDDRFDCEDDARSRLCVAVDGCVVRRLRCGCRLCVAADV